MPARVENLTMPELEASRTLVKSAPELWAECSDPAALARHLGAFGEIRITKLEPETTVAWEGDEVRGTVTLESSGWGTRVVITATPEASADPAPEPGQEPTPEPEPEPALAAQANAEPVPDENREPALEPAVSVPREDPVVRPGLWARLFARLRGAPPEPPAVTPSVATVEDERPEEPVPVAESQVASEPAPVQAAGTQDEPAAPAATHDEPAAPAATRPASELQTLINALDSLGAAHRRPFSRA